jgi:hypothetical protein
VRTFTLAALAGAGAQALAQPILIAAGLPVHATRDFIAAMASASVSIGAAGAFRVESTKSNQIRVGVTLT